MSASMQPDPIVQSAARWFWWIAGLSLVNTVLFHTGSEVSFVIGLAMTTIANALFADNIVTALVVAGITIAFYFAMGVYAQRHRLWAFYVGLAVYFIDALIYVAVSDWMPVGFHAFAGYCIFRGIARVRELNRATAPATTSG